MFKSNIFCRISHFLKLKLNFLKTFLKTFQYFNFSGYHLYYNFIRFSVCLFNFLSKAADLIGLTFSAGLFHCKSQRSKQDGVCSMHNWAWISIIIPKRGMLSILHLLVGLYFQSALIGLQELYDNPNNLLWPLIIMHWVMTFYPFLTGIYSCL